MAFCNDNARAIAALMPHGAALIEFGAGSALKAKILLNAAPQIAAYVPVDISAEFLADEARKLERDIPRVGVHPVAADFTAPFELPAAVRARPRVGFFPGSTIGNFEPPEAKAFLRQAARNSRTGRAASSSAPTASRTKQCCMRPTTTRPA